MLNGDNHTLGAAPFEEHAGEHTREIAWDRGPIGVTYSQVKERLQQAVDLLLDGQRMLRFITDASLVDPPPPAVKGKHLVPTVSAGASDPELLTAASVKRPAAPTHDESSPTLLRIYALGRLQVCRGDREITT